MDVRHKNRGFFLTHVADGVLHVGVLLVHIFYGLVIFEVEDPPMVGVELLLLVRGVEDSPNRIVKSCLKNVPMP